MKTILVHTKSQAKATGKCIGSLVNYDEAPEWMQRQQDSFNKPISEEMASKIAVETEKHLKFAKTYRAMAAGIMDETGKTFEQACAVVNDRL